MVCQYRRALRNSQAGRKVRNFHLNSSPSYSGVTLGIGGVKNLAMLRVAIAGGERTSTRTVDVGAEDRQPVTDAYKEEIAPRHVGLIATWSC